jgi:futalosine hydrolase
MTSRPSLLIAAAVPAELSLISGRLSGRKIVPAGHVRLLTGRICGRRVSCLVTGPGPVNMAGALGAVFSRHVPKALIVTGSGGGFEGSGLSVGDIALATEEIHAQLGREDRTAANLPHPLDFLENRIELDQTLAEEAYHVLLKERDEQKTKVFKSPFLTVATVTSRAETALLYRAGYGAIVENMEGFAAAALCRYYQVPIVELRAISNMVGTTDRNSWKLDRAVEKAQKGVLTIIEEGII